MITKLLEKYEKKRKNKKLYKFIIKFKHTIDSNQLLVI